MFRFRPLGTFETWFCRHVARTIETRRVSADLMNQLKTGVAVAQPRP